MLTSYQEQFLKTLYNISGNGNTRVDRNDVVNAMLGAKHPADPISHINHDYVDVSYQYIGDIPEQRVATFVQITPEGIEWLDNLQSARRNESYSKWAMYFGIIAVLVSILIAVLEKILPEF